MERAILSVDVRASDPESMRMERHGYVNLINVVHAELQLIERMIDAPGSLRETIKLADAASRAFRERRTVERHVAGLSRFSERVEADISEALSNAGVTSPAGDVAEAIAILMSVLPDADLRVQETIARHGAERPPDGALPAGMRACIERFVAALATEFGVPLDSYELVTHESGAAGDHARVSVRGPGNLGAFEPLTSAPTPGQLHEAIHAGAALLRDTARLFYFTVPDGELSVTADGGTIEVVAVAGRIAIADESFR